jgi:hypothetical protein
VLPVRRRLLAPFPLLALLLASACSDLEVEEIAFRLSVDSVHRCEGAGLSSTYGAGVFGVYLQMAHRDTKQIYRECVDTYGVYDQLSQLQGKLGQVVFERVQSGRWDFWVLGSDNPCWKQMTQTRLCGTVSVEIPPPGAVVSVPITCEDPLSDQATLEAIKRQIKDCRSGMPPWLP